MREAEALVSIGPFTERAFLSLEASPEKIVRIPNGVDRRPILQHVDRPAELEASIQPGKYILFIGRLSSRKGIDVLLNAVECVDGGGIRCVIAGDGDQRVDLQQRATRLGIADRVYFTGRVEGAAKVYLLQNCLATVLPSRTWEASPLAALESFAAGKPVIATRIPGLEDVVQHERTGLLVAPESAEELAGAIHRVSTDGLWLKSAGETAFALAADLDWEMIARRHLQLYSQISQRRKKQT